MTRTLKPKAAELLAQLTAALEGHPVGLVPDTYIFRATGVNMWHVQWFRHQHNMPSYRPTRCAGRPHSPLMHLGVLLAEKGESWTRDWAERALDKGISAAVEQALLDRDAVGTLAGPTRGDKPTAAAYKKGSKTYSAKSLTQGEWKELQDPELADIVVDRPKTRADCINGLRPCPYISCKFNLFSDVSSIGSLIINRKEMEDPSSLKQSCALDVADQGGKTLEEVGEAIGLTRERIRQIEVMSLEKLRNAGFDLEGLFYT